MNQYSLKNNLVPLFLKLYRILNIMAIVIFLLSVALFYFWFLKLDKTRENISLNEKKYTPVELDKKNYQKIKNFLNQKRFQSLFPKENLDLPSKDPFNFLKN